MGFELIKNQLELASKGLVDVSAFYSSIWKNWNTLNLIDGDQLKEVLQAAGKLSVTDRHEALRVLSEGLIFTLRSDFKKAIPTLNEAALEFSKLKEDAGSGVAKCFLVICYRSLGQLDKAQNSLGEALKLLKNTKEDDMYGPFLTITYYQAGELAVSYKKYDKAIEYFNSGLDYEKKDIILRSRMLSGIGGVHLQTSEWEKSITFFNKSLGSIKGLGNFLLESKLYTDIGNYYSKKNELDTALSYHHKSLEIRADKKMIGPAITNYIQLSELYFKKKNISEAVKYGELAAQEAGKLNLIPKLYEAHRILSEIYEATNDISHAFEHFKKFTRYREEVHSQEVTRRIEQISSQHEIEIVEQQKEIVHLRNVELKSALDHINESFRYAGRIQKAILPPERQINKLLPDNFVIYKPKDIVAGDFYWLESWEDSILFAAADCTGHGVPGAMVSVVCHNALNRAVREFNITVPSKVLDKTTDLVIEQFEKSDDDVKDGMDIALCCLTGNLLQYSGANNPLWILRKGQLLETKATKQPIGKHTERKPFVNHEIELEKGDVIYLFSDGYTDQFGGENGKKFGGKRLRELLLTIGEKPMQVQKTIITDNFKSWQGHLEQVDDVCFLGVKV